MLLLTNLCYDLVDKSNDRLIDLMSLINSLDHLCFRDLISACFDHDYLFGGRCYRQVQVTLLPLLLGRVNDKFSINHSNLCHCAGAVKGNIGNTCGNGGTQHGNQLRAAHRIHTHDHIV